MSDRMIPINFGNLILHILTEERTVNTVFGVRKPYMRKTKKRLSMFGEHIETPFGPAAGPNTQLAQNIAASYYAGSRFFELKTVQKLDGEDLKVEKPCILAEDECYNTEWSTELTVPQAFDEYVKAWWACKLMALEFELGEPDGFMFNMSVGYDLEGIKTPKIDKFIEGLKEASDTPIWKECRSFVLENLFLFKHVSKEDVEKFSSTVCTSITLSTLHGCPPQEIERIAAYLLNEKGLNTFIKCNPTLLGYEYARKTLDLMGYDYIQFGDFHFKDDLQYKDAVPMLNRLLKLAEEQNLQFGVKLTNTFPVDITRKELPGNEMYMSGRSLYALTLSVAEKLSGDFNGNLRISYSGGADYFNISRIYRLGIWPITLATTVLKPGGYQRMVQLAQELEALPYKEFSGVDVKGLGELLREAKTDVHHVKPVKALPSRKLSRRVPLTECYIAPCEEGCPIHQDITAYMKLNEAGRYTDAMKVITYKNPLPFITGTICAHNCMARCTRNFYETPVRIRDMKLMAAANGYEEFIEYLKEECGKVKAGGSSAAVIGAGPAGLAAAYLLSRAGMKVTIYEKRANAGGIIRSVIPDFRISQDAIDKDIQLVLASGVKIEYNHEVKSIEELKRGGYSYIIIASGASKPGAVNIDGAEPVNSLAFLEEYKAGKNMSAYGKNIAVVGGGNTAMDTARAAKRIAGVEHVYLVYRRDRRNMPAEEEELILALADGVEFMELLSPVSLLEGKLICRKNVLGDYDASGRRNPVETDERIELSVDSVIAAVGEKVDDEFYLRLGICVNEKGYPVTDENNMSSCENVYIAGDGLNGPSTVVSAIHDASVAADAIIAREYAGKPLISKLINDAMQLIVEINSSVSRETIIERKGILRESCEMDVERCLSCNAVCENCVDVCPNRANVSIMTPGFVTAQVIHIDSMCNECGNCTVFCPYSSSPYKDKFTLFSNKEAFEDSTNQGFLLLDEESRNFRVRFNGRVSDEDIYEVDCSLPDDIKALIQAVYENYQYYFNKG